MNKEICVVMVQNAKKNYYNNLNVRNTTDNKQLWKTMKPFFSDKVDGNEEKTLIEEDKFQRTKNCLKHLSHTLRLLWEN